MADFLTWWPTDLSLRHLHRTWAYWLLVIFLIAEMAYFQPRSLRFLRDVASASHPTSGPWGSAKPPSSKAIWAVRITTIVSFATLMALLLASALAFYTALIGLIPALLRFADEIPHATTGETIGAAIGSLIGVALQILLIIAVVSSIDPASQFPLRLPHHLDQKATL